MYCAVLEKYYTGTTEVVDVGMVSRNKKPKVKALYHYTLGNKICLKKSKTTRGPFCIFSLNLKGFFLSRS